MGSNACAQGAAYDPNTIMHLLCVPSTRSTFNSIEIRSIYFDDCWVLLSNEMPGFHCRLAAAVRRQSSAVIGDFLRYAVGISGLTKAPFEAGFEPAPPGYEPDAFTNQLYRSCCQCLCDCILPSGFRKIVEKKLRTQVFIPEFAIFPVFSASPGADR